MSVDAANEKILAQVEKLKHHLHNAPGLEHLAILVYRSGRQFPSEKEIDEGILAAARKDVARGILTR